ncbi:MAG: MarR family winged helix-turn-helix transcriptional regulator [Stellaceae bacterium]
MAAEQREPVETPDNQLSKRDYELLAEFRHLLVRFLNFSESAARQHGLTVQQHQTLLAVKGFPDRESITIGELAGRLDIRHHSAVGLVDRLAAKELIRRHAGPDDRRQVLLELTPKAEDLLAQLSVVHRAELKRTAPLLRDLFAHFERGSLPKTDG